MHNVLGPSNQLNHRSHSKSSKVQYSNPPSQISTSSEEQRPTRTRNPIKESQLMMDYYPESRPNDYLLQYQPLNQPQPTLFSGSSFKYPSGKNDTLGNSSKELNSVPERSIDQSQATHIKSGENTQLNLELEQDSTFRRQNESTVHQKYRNREHSTELSKEDSAYLKGTLTERTAHANNDQRRVSKPNMQNTFKENDGGRYALTERRSSVNEYLPKKEFGATFGKERPKKHLMGTMIDRSRTSLETSVERGQDELDTKLTMRTNNNNNPQEKKTASKADLSATGLSNLNKNHSVLEKDIVFSKNFGLSTKENDVCAIESKQLITDLESLLKSKENFVEDLKTQHENLLKRFENAQQEMHRLHFEKETETRELKEVINKLTQQLAHNDSEKQQLLSDNTQIIAENKHLSELNSELCSKLDSLNNKFRELKYVNKELQSELREKTSKSMRSADQSILNNLNRSIENYQVQIQALKTQRDETHRQNQALANLIREKEGTAVHEFHGDPLNRKSSSDETMKSYLNKIARLKKLVEQQQIENDELRAQLAAQSPIPKYQETINKTKNVGMELDQERKRSRSGHRWSELEIYKNLVEDLQAELEINNINNLLARVKEIANFERTMRKFTNAVADMVIKCSPEGMYASAKPTIKESWKFIKTVMEEFFTLRKQVSNDGVLATERQMKASEEILDLATTILNIKDKQKLPHTLKKLIEANKQAQNVISKFKVLTGIESSDNPGELHKILDKEIKNRENFSNTKDRPKHNKVLSVVTEDI